MSDDALRDAWSEALPAVLALLERSRRDGFRHEMQRFLAMTRFQREAADTMAEPLRELLLHAARAARQPAAIAATREHGDGRGLIVLCEHLVAIWRDSEAAAEGGVPVACADGLGGEIVWGPRLGGAGRGGAVRRPEDQ